MTPQPPFPPPPQPPRKSRRTLRIVLIIVAAVVALCCLCGVGGGLWLFRASEPPREATRAHLDDIIAEDYRSAYSNLCRQVRSATSEQDFIRMHSEGPRPVDYRITGFHIDYGPGQTVANISTRLEMDDGGRQSHTFFVVKEGDVWRVCE